MTWRIFQADRGKMVGVRAISLLAVLLTLELATRWFRPGNLNQSRFDPDLGYLLKPHLREVITNRESRETYELTTNSLGFRGPEWTIPKPDGVKRIAVLGDSFVESRSYEEHRIFCGRLESLLNAVPNGERWEVMNLGMSGHNTATELALYEKLVTPLEPDYVLVCVTISNDIRDNIPELSRNNVLYCDLSDAGELIPQLPYREEDRELKSRSKFYLWQKAKVQMLIDKVRNLEAMAEVTDPVAHTRARKLEEAKWLTQVPLDEQYERAWEHTEKLLEQFEKRVSQHGSRLILVSIPNAWQIHPELFERMKQSQSDSDVFEIDQPVERFASISQKLGIPLIDLVSPFRDECDSHCQRDGREATAELLFLNGIGHFTEFAHQLTAREIFAEIRARELGSHHERTEQLAREAPVDASRN
jgi:hypothetical protein